MSCNPSKLTIWIVCAALLFSGCTPSAPMFECDNGDMSYYLEQATRIDYPDVATATLDEVTQARRPITVIDPDFDSFYDLTLEDCVGIMLQNSKTIRGYGTPSLQGERVAPGIDNLANGPAAAGTVYNVAIRETEPGFIGTPGQISGPGSITTNTGLEGNQGVEAALADFDAQYTSSLLWNKSDEPRNTILNSPLNPLVFEQDTVQWQSEVAKKTANGTQIFFRNVNLWTENNIPLAADGGFQQLDSWYRTALEVELRQPLLRGRGAFIQRMPIVISRIGTDQELANLEAIMQNSVTNVEIRYWELYCAYRNLDAAKTGRNAALETWRIINDQYQEGLDVNKQQRAQAAEQYYFFNAQVIRSYNDLLNSEGNLRFLMGIASTDCRVIRPIDEATFAPIEFDWCSSLCEALTYRPELRQERWEIKKKELSLAYSKNSLLPELNVTGLYRWLGLGNFQGTSQDDAPFPNDNSGAINELYQGNYQEFQFGVDYRMPVGFRRELSNVRNAQLKLARELARLEDMELDVARELADAFRALAANQLLMQEAFNQWKETRIEEDHFLELKDAGVETLDVALDAQRRRSTAEQAFYTALCEYNKVLALIHRRKGTTLSYSGICLAEGQWAGKAYLDAQANARRRGASKPADVGWSRPGVISQGPSRPGNNNQGIPMTGAGSSVSGMNYGEITNSGVYGDGSYMDQTYMPNGPSDITPLVPPEMLNESGYPVEEIFVDPLPESTPAPGMAPTPVGPTTRLNRNSAMRDGNVRQTSHSQPARSPAPQRLSPPQLINASTSVQPARDAMTAPSSQQITRPQVRGDLNWDRMGLSAPDNGTRSTATIKFNQ